MCRLLDTDTVPAHYDLALSQWEQRHHHTLHRDTRLDVIAEMIVTDEPDLDSAYLCNRAVRSVRAQAAGRYSVAEASRCRRDTEREAKPCRTEAWRELHEIQVRRDVIDACHSAIAEHPDYAPLLPYLQSGQTQTEIGRELGVSQSVVSQTISAIRRMLRPIIADCLEQ